MADGMLGLMRTWEWSETSLVRTELAKASAHGLSGAGRLAAGNSETVKALKLGRRLETRWMVGFIEITVDRLKCMPPQSQTNKREVSAQQTNYKVNGRCLWYSVHKFIYLFIVFTDPTAGKQCTQFDAAKSRGTAKWHSMEMSTCTCLLQYEKSWEPQKQSCATSWNCTGSIWRGRLRSACPCRFFPCRSQKSNGWLLVVNSVRQIARSSLLKSAWYQMDGWPLWPVQSDK